MKRAIIIIIVIVVIVAIVLGIFFLLNRPTGVATAPTVGTTGPLFVNNGTSTAAAQGSAIPGIPSGTTLYLGDAALSPADLSAGPPADAPQGATIQFQTASGTVTLKNFYPGSQAYWGALDTLLLTYNSAYSIWYYRDTSSFVIEIPLNGTTADEDNAAAVLGADLGVSQQALCGLPVDVVFVIDRGTDGQDYPLDFCPTPGVINPQ